MTATVLDRITLGYRLLWNRHRGLAGIALFMRPDPAPRDGPQLEAAELIESLRELWSEDSPPLYLVPQAPRLLADLLACTPGTRDPEPEGGGPLFQSGHQLRPVLVVPESDLGVAGMRQAVRQAHARGVAMVLQGDADAPPDMEVARCFRRRWLSLPPLLAAQALQAGLRLQSAGIPPGAAPVAGPLPSEQIYDGIAGRALMEYCLDRRHAFALVGWPSEDVLHSLRHLPMQPDHRVVQATLQALEADRAAEVVERTLMQDAVLTYRFLTYANSPGLGLRGAVDSVRHGLMMLGVNTLAAWLAQQLPNAEEDDNLRPVKAQLTLRARLMDRILDAGAEEALRREVLMCGLFSGLGELLDEPLGALLHRLPLSRRIYEATVLRTGPYAASLAMTIGLEGEDTAAVRRLREKHEMEAGEVNRALVRTLAAMEAPARAGG
ncbi:MAG: HDOD domain-containing protein [Xylophilus ampelinus]